MKPFGESAGASGGGTGAQPWTLYRPGERWLMLFVLFLIGLITMIDRNITAILLEPLKKEFQVSDTMLGLLSGFAFAPTIPSAVRSRSSFASTPTSPTCSRCAANGALPEASDGFAYRATIGSSLPMSASTGSRDAPRSSSILLPTV